MVCMFAEVVTVPVDSIGASWTYHPIAPKEISPVHRPVRSLVVAPRAASVVEPPVATGLRSHLGGPKYLCRHCREVESMLVASRCGSCGALRCRACGLCG